jgi:hypothetical protein
MEDFSKNKTDLNAALSAISNGSPFHTATEEEPSNSLLNRPIKSDLLQIKPISFETKTLRNIKENQSRQASFIQLKTLSANSANKNILTLVLIALLGIGASFLVWKTFFSKSSKQNKPSIASSNQATQSSQDSSDADQSGAISSEDLTEAEEGYRDSWLAAYKPIDSLLTSEDRSIVLLPYSMKGASAEERCFGTGKTQTCIPKNLLKVTNHFCIETKFSDNVSDREISEIAGYIPSETETTGSKNLDNENPILLFDKFTASRHKFRKRNTSKAISWKLVKCPV